MRKPPEIDIDIPSCGEKKSSLRKIESLRGVDLPDFAEEHEKPGEAPTNDGNEKPKKKLNVVKQATRRGRGRKQHYGKPLPRKVETRINKDGTPRKQRGSDWDERWQRKEKRNNRRFDHEGALGELIETPDRLTVKSMEEVREEIREEGGILPGERCEIEVEGLRDVGGGVWNDLSQDERNFYHECNIRDESGLKSSEKNPADGLPYGGGKLQDEPPPVFEGGGVRINYVPQPKQMLLHQTPANEVLYGGAAGPGKAQPLDAEIITPFGIRPMGSMKVGSLICSPDGSVGSVIAVHDRGEMSVYRVVFADGTSTETAGDHLWLAWRSRRGNKKNGRREFGEESARIYTVDMLREAMNRSGTKFRIPVCEPVRFTDQARYSRRPVDPWLMGILLGDGGLTTAAPSVTTSDGEIIERLRMVLGEDFRGPHEKGKGGNFRIDITPSSEIVFHLKKFGLLGKYAWEKSVPKSYLLGTVEERWELLRGLMDSDGWSDNHGDVYFSSSSEQLSKNVAFLARSLGAYVTETVKRSFFTVNGEKKAGRLAYVIRIKMRDGSRCFSLKRKKAKCASGPPQSMGREIVKIEFSRLAECRCITVSHPDGLYMTNDFIVTHNSHALRMEGLMWCLRVPGIQVYLFRRTFPELEKNHIIPSLQMFPGEIGRYKERYKRWEFYNGSMLHFCHAQHENDIFGYQGAEIHLLLIDELTTFTKAQYDYLRGRVRCPLDFEKLGLPKDFHIKIPGIVCASNPGGVGHQFVKERWVDFARPYELKRAEKKDGGMLRCYIPGLLEDNKVLMKQDPDYVHRLDALAEPYRTAYKEGRWDIFFGQAFAFRSDHVIKPMPIPDHAPLYFTFDYGFGKPFSCLWWWVDGDGRLYCFSEWYGQMPGMEMDTGLRLTDTEVGEGILTREMNMGIRGRRITRLTGPDCFSKKADYRGGGQGPSTAEVFARMGIFVVAGDPNRKLKIRQFHERLRLFEDRPPMVQIYDTCKHFIRTIPLLQSDKADPEDIDTAMEDHCYDSACLVFMARPLKLLVPEYKKTGYDARLERLERNVSGAGDIETIAIIDAKKADRHISQELGIDLDAAMNGSSLFRREMADVGDGRTIPVLKRTVH